VADFSFEQKELPHGLGGPSIRTRLEVTAEQDEREDEDRSVKIGNVMGHKCCPGALGVRKRAHRYEHIHVCPIVGNGDGRLP